MHNAENEVTRETMEVAAIIGALRAGGDMHGSAVFLQRHITASIEAACREKEDEIERLQAANIDIGYDLRRVEAERDRLRAKLDEARRLLKRAMALAIPYPDWKSDVRDFLASAPQPTPPASEEG